MTTELKATLVEHAAGNYRVLMNLADELLSIAIDKELPRLDEKLFLKHFQPSARPKTSTAQSGSRRPPRSLLATTTRNLRDQLAIKQRAHAQRSILSR